MGENIDVKLEGLEFCEVCDGVFFVEGVRLGEFIVMDMSEGLIVVDCNVKIGFYCYLSGLVYFGFNVRVIEYFVIKDVVFIGYMVKIGGEVEVFVIELFINK